MDTERGDVEHLTGNVGGAIRVGDTVIRPAGPWTPAVHRLLGHLAGTGLEGVPEVLATDGTTETLSYLPGRSLEPATDTATDDQLAEVAAWLRRFHDAVRSFRPADALVWRGHPDPVVLGPDQLVCHNDPGTYNWIVEGERFAGMIDWDMAGPGHAIDDLAFLAWTGVPLVREVPEPDAVRRTALLIRAYGSVAPVDLLAAAERRMRGAAERIAAGQRRGDPGLLRLAEIGEPAATLAAVDRFARRRPALAAALASDASRR